MWQNSNCDKTHNLKWWQNSKLKLWQNSTTQNVTKLNFWQNSRCDKTQIVGKKTQIVTKLKLWQNWNGDKTQIVREKSKNSNVTKHRLLQNLRIQITTKLKNWNCDKTFKKKLKLGQNLEYNKSQFMKTKKNLKVDF